MEVVMKGFSEHEGRGAGWAGGAGGPGGFGGRGGHRGRGPGGGRGFGRGFGRPGGWQQADLPSVDDVDAWFAGRLPGDWFTGAASVETDREEITVVGEIAAPEYPANADDAAKRAADAGRIGLFREQTREARMKISDEAESRYGRKVAWGASIGETSQLFTHLAVPVMTRLRQPDRQVLDTLVDSGVARSRSEALAWCVRLVGEHTDDWLSGLRAAMSEVDKLRAEGPGL
jgi:hypothetical protein